MGDREAIVRMYRRAIVRARETQSLLYLWGIREDMLRYNISFEELHTTESGLDVIIRSCDVAYCLRRINEARQRDSWLRALEIEDMIATGRVSWNELDHEQPATRAWFQAYKQRCTPRTLIRQNSVCQVQTSPD